MTTITKLISSFMFKRPFVIAKSSIKGVAVLEHDVIPVVAGYNVPASDRIILSTTPNSLSKRCGKEALLPAFEFVSYTYTNISFVASLYTPAQSPGFST